MGRAIIPSAVLTLACAAPVRGQAPPVVEPGDTVRVTFSERGRSRMEGRVLRATADTLVVARAGGDTIAVVRDEVSVLQRRVARGFDAAAARRSALRGALIGAAPGLALAAGVTYDAQTAEDRRDGALLALIGLAAGAGAGYVIGGKGHVARESAIAGVIVGAVAGAVVGLISYEPCTEPCFVDLGPGVHALAGAGAGTLLGGLTGLGIGLTRQSYDWRLADMPPAPVALRFLLHGRAGVGVRLALRLN